MSFQLISSLITGVSIGALSGFLGTLMLSKRMALVAGPLGHLALPGIALALIFGFNISFGAFPFIILGMIFVWFLKEKTNLPPETLVALVFATFLTISFLLLPLEKAKTALIGNVDKVSFEDSIFSFILSFFIFLFIKKIYSKLVLINICEDLAFAEKINIKKINFFYFFFVAIAVALAVKLVGGLLTAALFAIPPASGRNFAKNLFQFKFFSAGIGAFSALSGILSAKFFFFEPGLMIILINFLIFLISLAFVKK